MDGTPNGSGKPPITGLDRILTIELVRTVERAAVAAARWRGQGDERAADQAAIKAMRLELDRLPVRGAVVIGEGSREDAASLYVGETVGNGEGVSVDFALDPLESKTACAKNLPNALSVVVVAEEGGLLAIPPAYMEKIAIGPGYPEGVVSLKASSAKNIENLAKAKGVGVAEITACILDRPRHAKLIDAVRATGAQVRLIGDGDVAGVIDTTDPSETGIDIYLGSGGAREGVFAAAALRCIGGQMQGRLILDSSEKIAQALKLGIDDPSRIYRAEDMARGDVLFAATGVTDGSLLAGVKFEADCIRTDTIVLRSSTRTVREIKARHQDLDKF